MLHAKANAITCAHRGNKVYYRGLLEFSNICIKDCNYCGIRKSNTTLTRYDLTDDEIVEAALKALNDRYGSIVLQSGERANDNFVNRIDNLLKRLKKESDNNLGITLSLGEQTFDTYKRWYQSGAHRYLLRVETTNKQLYEAIHPTDKLHTLEKRLEALYNLKKIGYRTGTGVMIGLPGQTVEDLVDDIFFMQKFEVDMIGMGPFVVHENTPLAKAEATLWPEGRRLSITLNMIAVIRILMPGINIAAATALQAIDPMGREKALKAGANIIMPNITPASMRKHYTLYDNKPCIDETADDCLSCLTLRVSLAGKETGWNEWGDPPR